MTGDDIPTPNGATPNDTPADTPGGTPVSGPALTLAQAVEVTGVSRSTLQRRLRAGDLDGATRTTGGGWAIPYRALIAAGLVPARTPADTPAPVEVRLAPAPTVEVDKLRAEVDRLRAEVEARDAALIARDAHLADLRAALDLMARALPAGPAVRPARSRWWHRGERTGG